MNARTEQRLNFETMDEMMGAYNAASHDPKPGQWERGSFWVAMAAAAFGLILGNVLEGAAALWGAMAGLVIEVAGLAVSLTLTLKREWPDLKHPKRTMALNYDHDYSFWNEYIRELRKFPIQTRERMLRYVRHRRERMHQRTGLLIGGLERLGVLPVLFALYFQFKDWKWGDWAMLAEINLVQGLLIWALLLIYAVGWRLVNLHARAESYEELLTEACLRDVEKPKPTTRVTE